VRAWVLPTVKIEARLQCSYNYLPCVGRDSAITFIRSGPRSCGVACRHREDRKSDRMRFAGRQSLLNWQIMACYVL
jgi:hypothetical protein